MYTKEQDGEIEKVCRVFADYIKENSYFDVVWSEKSLQPFMNQLPEYMSLVEEIVKD